MAYTRKTKDSWDILTNYGYGWEVECSYDNYVEAKRDLADYREHTKNYGGSAIIAYRRIKLN